jgi:hypothetical protein
MKEPRQEYCAMPETSAVRGWKMAQWKELRAKCPNWDKPQYSMEAAEHIAEQCQQATGIPFYACPFTNV